MATTPNMNLDLPDVGTTAGPEYASKNNAAFDAVDTHDHTSGKGVQVPTAGINVNADFTFNSYNVEGIRTARLDNLTGTPTGVDDVRVIYAKSDELFYRDSAGQEIQITNNGFVNSGSGTITGLVPNPNPPNNTPSAYFSNTNYTFRVDWDSNKQAKTETSDITFFEFDNATANGITLKSPASVGSAYSLTLPTTQAADATFEIVGIDSTGQLKYGAVTSTANQTTVSKTTSGYQIGTVQDINTSADVQFNTLQLAATGATTPGVTSPDGNSGLSVNNGTNYIVCDNTQVLTAISTRVSVSAEVDIDANNITEALDVSQNGTGDIAKFRDSGTERVTIEQTGNITTDGGIATDSNADYIKWEVFDSSLTGPNTITFTVGGNVLGFTGRAASNSAFTNDHTDINDSVAFSWDNSTSASNLILRNTTASDQWWYRVVVFYV